MYPNLKETIDVLDTSSIDKERCELLNQLATVISDELQEGNEVNLNFICTHNSRRSHLGQLWCKTLSEHFGIDQISTYSGGTEATAMFPMIRKTLEGQGFVISPLSEGSNPVYAISTDENAHPNIAFSKKYEHPFNPKNGYIAVMTCNSADKGCPIVTGAKHRLPITYVDPKVSDGTPQQAEVYLERSTQIATEMKYVFQQVNSIL